MAKRLYTRRTILSENINRTRLSREFEKHSKRSRLTNENYDDDEDDAEFFDNIKKKIFKDDAPQNGQHPVMYTSTRKTSRLDENFWKVMKNFKQNLKKQRERRVMSPPQGAVRKKERKSNSFECGNEDAFSRLERPPLECEINSKLGNGSRGTSTHAPAFSFSDDITLSPAVLSLKDERLEEEIEKEVYCISANRLMDLCENVNVQSPATSFKHYSSLVASPINSPYRQFDSEPD